MARPSPAAAPAALPGQGTEAAARLASLRQALRAADMMAGKTAEQLATPIDITEVWAALPQATRRCFTARSERAASAAGAGLALFNGGPLNPAATERLREELRRSLAHVDALFAGR